MAGGVLERGKGSSSHIVEGMVDDVSWPMGMTYSTLLCDRK